MKIMFASLLGAFAIAITHASVAYGNDVTLSNAYVTTPPPGSPVAAAYFEISNDGDTKRVITGASGPCAKSLSLHKSTVDQGIARMEAMPEVPIEPGEKISFAPRGLHVMLHHPALAGAAECKFTLRFKDGTQIDVAAEIRRIQPLVAPTPKHTMHMHHDHGDQE